MSRIWLNTTFFLIRNKNKKYIYKISLPPKTAETR